MFQSSHDQIQNIMLGNNLQKNNQLFCPNCNQNVQPSHCGIYTCCYELTCSKCYKQNHYQECRSYVQGKSYPNFTLLNLAIINKHYIAQSKMNYKHNKNEIYCAHCQDQLIYNTILNCLNCQNIFCKKCSDFIHSKGKFLTHNIQNVIVNPQCQQKNNQFTICQSHNKPRKHILKNKIVCQDCLKQKAERLRSISRTLNTQDNRIQAFQQNLKFTFELFDQTYQNQAAKLSEIKQTLKNYYNKILIRIQQKFTSNINLLEKLEINLKKQFENGLILSTNKILNETQLYSNLINKQNQNLKQKQNQNQRQKQNSLNNIFTTRIQLLQDKLLQIQEKFQQYLNSYQFEYKLSDLQRNQTFLQQFLRGFIITKSKKQQDQVCTNRSSKNYLTSRATSRPSNLRGNSKQRCVSSFKKYQQSNNKQTKTQQNNQPASTIKMMNSSNKFLVDDKLSNRKSVTKSIIPNSTRTNPNIIKEKLLKQQSKVEHQQINLKRLNFNSDKDKLMRSTKPEQFLLKLTRINTQQNHIPHDNILPQNRIIQSEQKNTLKQLQITVNQQQQYISNQQNQQSLLKVLQKGEKSKQLSGRKNYFISSAEDLQQSNAKSNCRKSSPRNIAHRSPDQKPIKIPSSIKKQIPSSIKRQDQHYKTTRSSNLLVQQVYKTNNFLTNLNSSHLNNLSKSNIKQSNKTSDCKNTFEQSIAFSNVIAVSCQRQTTNLSKIYPDRSVTQFNSKDQQNSPRFFQVENVQMTQSYESFTNQIDNKFFTNQINIKSSTNQVNTQNQKINQQKIKQNISMCASIDLGYKAGKNDDKKIAIKNVSQMKNSVASTRKISTNVNPQPTTRQMLKSQRAVKVPLQNTKFPAQSNGVFNDITNKQIQKLVLQKSQKIKKKPEVLDMKQKMKKPNYLSTRLANNLKK